MRLILPKAPEVAADSRAAKEKAVTAAKRKICPMRNRRTGKRHQGCRGRAHSACHKVQEVGGLYGRALMAIVLVVVVARGAISMLLVGWSIVAALS